MTALPVGRGRPLRFLAGLTGGWVALRAAMLWPTVAVPDVRGLALPALSLPSLVPVAMADTHGPAWRRIAPHATILPPRARPPAPPGRVFRDIAPDPHRVALALLGLVRFGDADLEPPAPVFPGVPHALPPTNAARFPPRLSGSFWLVVRGGGGIAPGVVGGQLGGSQAGLRLAYLFDRKHRLAIAVRATTPLGPGAREFAAGIEWQPTRLPIRLVAEQRFVVAGGGKGGPAIGVVGGLGPKRLGAGVTLEAYGQAGVIRRTRAEAYADGAAHLAHPLLDLGGAKLDIGAGVWAGAQRGAERVDIGPTLALTLPVAHKSVRLSLDWRQRVAGQARPGSGIALTLGADF